jgi:hypothetical protein
MGIRSLKTASISTGIKRSKVWDQSAVTTPYELLNSSFTGAATTFTQLSGTTVPQAGVGAISNMVVAVGGSSKTNQYRYFQSGAWQNSTVSYPEVAADVLVISDGNTIITLGGEVGATYSAKTHKNTGVNTAFTAGVDYPYGIIAAGAASGPAISGKYYNVGGIITGINDATNKVYSTTSAIGGWSAETNYPLTIRSNNAVSYGGLVYAAGGYVTGFRTNMYTYSGSGAWSASTSLPYESAAMGLVAVAGSGIYGGVNSYNGVPLSGVRFYKWNGSSWSITSKQPQTNPPVGEAYNQVAQTADGYIALIGGNSMPINYIQASSWT